jgi:hypothetical protein
MAMVPQACACETATVNRKQQTKRIVANYDEIPAALYDGTACYDEVAPPQSERTKMAKVKLDLASLDPDGMTGKADAIKTAMTGNANFPTPNPPLATLGTDNTTAKTKVSAQKNAQLAAKQATTDRDAALDVVANDLTLLAAYVENASGGDREKILSSGMDVKSDRTILMALDRAIILALSVGKNPGEVQVKWQPVSGAKSYQVQYCVDPITDAGWKDAPPSSDRKTLLTGLTSGAKVWVQVRAIAKDNLGPWSEPSNIIVP